MRTRNFHKKSSTVTALSITFSRPGSAFALLPVKMTLHFILLRCLNIPKAQVYCSLNLRSSVSYSILLPLNHHNLQLHPLFFIKVRQSPSISCNYSTFSHYLRPIGTYYCNMYVLCEQPQKIYRLSFVDFIVIEIQTNTSFFSYSRIGNQSKVGSRWRVALASLSISCNFLFHFIYIQLIQVLNRCS